MHPKYDVRRVHAYTGIGNDVTTTMSSSVAYRTRSGCARYYVMTRTERKEDTRIRYVDEAVVVHSPVVTHLYDQRLWKMRFPLSPLRRMIHAIVVKAREIVLKATLGD